MKEIKFYVRDNLFATARTAYQAFYFWRLGYSDMEINGVRKTYKLGWEQRVAIEKYFGVTYRLSREQERVY